MAKDHNFNLNTWLADLELSDEDRTLLATKLGSEKNISVLEGNQMRQSAFNNRMNSLTSKEQELLSKETDLDRYTEELTNWKEEQTKVYGSNTTEAAKLAGENAALKKYLTDSGIDIAALGINLETPKPAPVEPTTTTPAIDTSKLVTREVGIALAKWPVIFRSLDAKHQQLFGSPMSDEQANEFLNKVLSDTREPSAIFEDHFKVADRRVELEKQDRANWEAIKTKEIEQRIMSDVLSRKHTPQSPLGASPVIESFGNKSKGNENWLDDATADYNRRAAATAATMAG